MKLNIITPYSRDLSYLKKIIKSVKELSSKIDVRWVIISEHRNYHEALNWSEQYYDIVNLTVEILKGNTETSFFGNSYRNQGLDRVDSDDSLTYFLDDDNILHPNFHDLIFDFIESEYDAIFFSQIEPDGSMRLRPVDIKVGGVDTAMLLARTHAAKKYRWVLDQYTADGIYASEIFQNEKCKIIYTPYCFYNFLKNNKMEDIEMKNTSGLEEILSEYSENYMFGETRKNSIFTSMEGFEIQSGETVVDIGSGIGIFASFASRSKAGRILCFETRKKFFESLILNKPHNCEAFNMELGSGITEDVLNIRSTIPYKLDYLYDMKIVEKIDFLKISTDNLHDILYGAESMMSLGLIDRIVFKSKNDFSTDSRNEEICNFLISKGYNIVRKKYEEFTINFAKKL